MDWHLSRSSTVRLSGCLTKPVILKQDGDPAKTCPAKKKISNRIGNTNLVFIYTP
jgi:hypothetical protein